MTLPRLKLGTRASPLARWQADWVARELETRCGATVELVPIASQGDQRATQPIATLGTSGVFTKQLQQALVERRIDLAVHSLKDLPTDVVDGLVLAAVPTREDPRDLLVSRAGETLAQLPAGARIGTGSLRRRAQLRHVRPDLDLLDIRGNVDTRLGKLDQGQFDALVLALAGLKRLGLHGRPAEVLSPPVMLPAVGQGALGIECRADDHETLALLACLDDRAAHQAVVAERAMLAALAGGCLAPVGALAQMEVDGALSLHAVVLSADGKTRLEQFDQGSPDEPVQLGRRVAERLLADGAGALIDAARTLG